MGKVVFPLKAVKAKLASAVANANRPAMADRQGTRFDALTLAQGRQGYTGEEQTLNLERKT